MIVAGCFLGIFFRNMMNYFCAAVCSHVPICDTGTAICEAVKSGVGYFIAAAAAALVMRGRGCELQSASQLQAMVGHSRQPAADFHQPRASCC